MLRLRFKPSRLCALFLASSYTLSAVCICLVPLPIGFISVLLCALLLNFLFLATHQAWRKSPFSIVALQLDRDGRVLMEQHNGTVHAVRILPSSFVTPYLTIVLFKTPNAWFARSIVIFPDMLAADLFRDLRIWLKWRLGRGALPQANIEWTGQL